MNILLGLLDPASEGTVILQDSEHFSPSDMVSHHRILKSSAVPLLEPEILYVYI